MKDNNNKNYPYDTEGPGKTPHGDTGAQPAS